MKTKLKTIVPTIMILVITILSLVNVIAKNKEISFEVDNKKIVTKKPILIQHNLALMSADDLFKSLGFTVEYGYENPNNLLIASKTIDGVDCVFFLDIDENLYSLSYLSENIILDFKVKPQIISNTLYVPVKDIVESLGCRVNLNNNIIKIDTSESIILTNPKNLVNTRYQISGEIIKISDTKHGKTILIKDKDKGEYLLNISKDTLFYNLKLENLKIGDTITAFIDPKMPVASSMPPQVTPDVIIKGSNLINDKNIFVDTFNKDLISSDNFLKLNISPETKIVDINGKKLTEKDLYNKVLMVCYTVSTKSIPAQTTPTEIIVLK